MLKKPRSRLLVMSFSALTVLLMLLSACSSGGTTSSTSTPTTGGTPVKGGTWIDDLYEEPSSLIPNASNETFAQMMDYALYAPLVYGTPQGQLKPALLTDVPTAANGGISADLKTWTLHFRSGLKWSDGQPLDARDFAFTVSLWSNPKFAAINLINNQDLLPGAAGMAVSSDNLTITFHLQNPLVSFMANWVDGFYAPMPMHHFASMDPGAILKSSDNLNPQVTSGPFMMSESKPTDHYTVVRNPNYYQAAQGLPYLDKVIFRIVPSLNTVTTDLQAGNIDSAYFLDVSKALVYKSLSSYSVVADPKTFSFEALYFNFNNKILANNPEVRQAMSMAVDQTTLIQVARRGLGGSLCTEHTVTQNPGYTQGVQCPKFDTTAANALLDSKGWVLDKTTGIRSKNGQKLEFQYSTTAGNLWRSDDQLINQQNFAKIGVKLDIQNYPASTFFGPILTDARPGTFDIAEYATANGYDADSAVLFQCHVPSNLGQYCNPAMDAQYKAEQSSAVPATRQAAFDKIHQIELSDFPFIVEFSSPNVSIHKNGTNNYAPSLVGVGETENIWQWWCNGGTCPA
jgi:peptide/nickel transport system substrate-binding protein